MNSQLSLPSFNPMTWTCAGLAFLAPAIGASCLLAQKYYYQTVTEPNALSYINNVLVLASNSLDKSASGSTNAYQIANETLQQLAGMAVAQVVNFVDSPTWNTNLSMQIAGLSGVGAFDAGYTTQMQYQEYQDWNAIESSINAGFGTGGEFAGVGDGLLYTSNALHNGLECGTGSATCSSFILASNAIHGAVSGSWWNFQVTTTFSPYFYLEPGAQVGFHPDVLCLGAGSDCLGSQHASPENATFTDLNTGTSFSVSKLTNNSFFNVSKDNTLTPGIHPGDVVQFHTTDSGGDNVLVQGGFPLTNITGHSGAWYPQLVAVQENLDGSIPSSPTTLFLPATSNYLCVSTVLPTLGDCSSSETSPPGNVPVVGNATAVGQGSGSLHNQPIETTFPYILSRLTNESLTLAHEYYTVLRVITDNGSYPIPPNCIVPQPQDALPGVTDSQTFGLNYQTGLAIYYAWLNDIGHFYGTDLTGGNFCGIGNSTFTFRWLGGWHPYLNVTASIYFGNANGSIYTTGAHDPVQFYNSTNTWVIQNSSPTYLFPSTFQLNVPLNTIYPIPFNDPVALVLPNWTGNSQYGLTSSKPAWGIPSYFEADGQGNRVNVQGNLTDVPSGKPLGQGFALFITSCTNNGTQENPCRIPVNFVNNLTFALQYGTSFACPPGLSLIGGCSAPPSSFGGGSALGFGDCGTGGLTAWYDHWWSTIVLAFGNAFAGLRGVPFVGPALVDLGCFLGWVVSIALSLGILYLMVRLGAAVVGSRRWSSRPGRSGGRSGGGSGGDYNVSVRRVR